jgi:predicted membrane protein
MNIISSGVFWGLILILIGLSIIIKIVFNIDIPIFRVIIGLLLIYFGMQIIFGSNLSYRRKQRIRNNEKQYSEYNLRKGSNEYNVVFGRSSIDLTDRKDLDSDNFVGINVVFGSASVYIDPEIPTQIELNTVFGSANLPGRKSAMIGQQRYHFGKDSDQGRLLYVEISSVFSSVEIIEKKRNHQPDNTENEFNNEREGEEGL